MAWQLEIHHIDVEQGDATLIVAREIPPLAGPNPTIRTALIDGGKNRKGVDVHTYLNNNMINNLNVIVATHYDRDHYFGLRFLFRTNHVRYSNVRVFDQGVPDPLEDDYSRYLIDLGKVIGNFRVTANVDSVHNPPRQGLNSPHWLVGQEILWSGVAASPAGSPTIKCIAANQYIQNAAGGFPIFTPSGFAVDPKNEKSLAFVVTFNNFKYYVGGDIETSQENAIQNFLNPANNLNGRVLAMKTSHHGSNRSTSREFVNQLRPMVAFVSVGINNTFNHPDPRVIDNLEYIQQVIRYYLTEDRSDAGYNLHNPALTYGPKAIVSGSWGLLPFDLQPLNGGDIMLTVTQAQSMISVAAPLSGVASHFTVTHFDRVTGLQHINY